MSKYTPVADPVVRYTLNGVLTRYDIPFPIVSTGDLVVHVDSTELTEAIDYQVEGDYVNAKGTVVLNDPYSDGQSLIIYRDALIKRVTNFNQAAKLNAQELDDEFNNVLYLLSDVAYEASQGIKLSIEDGTANPQLPKLVPNGYLGVSPNGKDFTITPLAQTTDFTDLKQYVVDKTTESKNYVDSEVKSLTNKVNQVDTDLRHLVTTELAKVDSRVDTVEGNMKALDADVNTKLKGVLDTAKDVTQQAQTVLGQSQQVQVNVTALVKSAESARDGAVQAAQDAQTAVSSIGSSVADAKAHADKATQQANRSKAEADRAQQSSDSIEQKINAAVASATTIAHTYAEQSEVSAKKSETFAGNAMLAQQEAERVNANTVAHVIGVSASLIQTQAIIAKFHAFK